MNLLANFNGPKAAGTESVNGVETVRIAGQVGADVANRFFGSTVANGRVPATAWIRQDGDHQLVRLQLEPSAGNSLLMTFSNWNAPVSVVKPPGV